MLGTLFTLAAIAGIIGLAGVIAIIFGIVYATRRGVYALKGEPYRPLLGSGSKNQVEYAHQDIDNGADEESVRAVFKRYMHTDGVGKHARAGMASLDSAERKSAGFHAVLDNKFQPGSLTWEKFAVAASSAQEAVLRNCAALANAIQVFDHADYRRLEQARRRSSFRSDYRLDATQQEQYRILQVKLGEMQAITNASEKILLELDKLTIELEKLDDAGSSAQSDQLIEEIRNLSAETKYYKDALDNLG